MIRAGAVESFLLARGKRPRWPGVPAEHRPRTIEDGYATQAAIHDRLAEEGGPRVGYKIGSTSAEGQRVFGLSAPIYAGIFEQTRFRSLRDGLSMDLVAPSVECEVAFVLGADLDASKGDLAASDVMGAVATCHLACEIIDNRYGKPREVGVPTMLADDFFHAGFVLGPPNPSWTSFDLAHLDAMVAYDGALFTGNSTNVLSATDSTLWLARELAAIGRRLQKGEVLLTGSIVPPTPIAPFPRALSLSIDGFESLHLGDESG